MRICKKLLFAIAFNLCIIPIEFAQATESNEEITPDTEITQNNDPIQEEKAWDHKVSPDNHFDLEDPYKKKNKAHLYLSLYAFTPKTDGTIGMGSRQISSRIPFSETWENLDFAFMGHVDLKKGKWGVYLDQQYAKVSMDKQAGVQITPNTAIPIKADLKTELNRTSIGMYYTALDTSEDRQRKRRFVLEPTVGIHLTNVSAKMNAFSPGLPYSVRESRSIYWSEPYLGTRFLYEFNEKWNLAGQVDFGTRHSKGYQVYLGYRTKLFNLPANVRIGYRRIDQKHREGDFNWHVKQYGPVIGVSLQFY